MAPPKLWSLHLQQQEWVALSLRAGATCSFTKPTALNCTKYRQMRKAEGFKYLRFSHKNFILQPLQVTLQAYTAAFRQIPLFVIGPIVPCAGYITTGQINISLNGKIGVSLNLKARHRPANTTAIHIPSLSVPRWKAGGQLHAEGNLSSHWYPLGLPVHIIHFCFYYLK